MNQRRDRRPIEKIAGSYATEKLRWLVRVARDPTAEYGMRLAVELALAHFNNDTGRCDPGDDKLAKTLETNTKKIQRMRTALISAGHVEHDRGKAGRRRDWNANHVLMLGPNQATTTGHIVSTNQSRLVDSFEPTGGQFQTRLVDSQNPIHPQAQELGIFNQIQEPDSYNQMRKNEGAEAQKPYRQTTGNAAAVANARAARVARKYGL